VRSRIACLTVLLLGGLAGPARAGDLPFVLPLGLQADAAYVAENAPLTADKAALGKLLYFDARLSRDRSQACATCHQPTHGFAEPRATSRGVAGIAGTRNAPTILNRLFSKEQFWDGRAADLEAQAHGPLTNPVEMAMPSDAAVVDRVRAVRGYAPLFAKAFGSPGITMARVGAAIAAYERTVTTGNSAFDRWRAGDADAMSASAVRGFALFSGKGNCIVCHTGFNFTDEGYHNVGVGMDRKDPDLGRWRVTKQDADRGAFKTPTLRNVALTAPYLHDGSAATLRDVIALYDRGGTPNPWLDKEMKPLGLTAAEQDDLLAFLEALSGDVTNAEPPRTLP
jgi:cytochrome c peroxidase